LFIRRGDLNARLIPWFILSLNVSFSKVNLRECLCLHIFRWYVKAKRFLIECLLLEKCIFMSKLHRIFSLIFACLKCVYFALNNFFFFAQKKLRFFRIPLMFQMWDEFQRESEPQSSINKNFLTLSEQFSVQMKRTYPRTIRCRFKRWLRKFIRIWSGYSKNVCEKGPKRSKRSLHDLII